MKTRLGMVLLSAVVGVAGVASPQARDARRTVKGANGVPAVFDPISVSDSEESVIYVVSENGGNSTFPVAFRKYGANSSTDAIIGGGGDPVQIVEVSDLGFSGMGTLKAEPPAGTHPVVVVSDAGNDASYASFPVFDDRAGQTCSAAWPGTGNFDFVVINPGNDPVTADVCADNRKGDFIGCKQVNNVPPMGGDVVNLDKVLGRCEEPPCVARAFATGNRVGCATWSKPANNDPGVRVFGGVVDGAGAGEFFTPAEPGEIIVTNLSGSAVDVNGESLDGSFMPSPVNLDAFESNAIPVGADDAAPGSVLEFSQPGNGSADTFGWTDLDPDVFPRQAAGAGTPREGVRAVTADDGGNRRALAVFPVPLSTVSNRLGVLNMGKGRAKLTIQYRDRTGKKLGKKKVTLKGKSAQLLDLPSKVAGKDGAYADIKIKGKKAAVWPYTRMEHDSGDVTIVPGIVVG